MVVPHMMTASNDNIDWDLTYANTTVAPRAQVESYHRVGEIYSARAIDARRPYGQSTLTVFEVADTPTGRWSYRYGWGAKGAYIGVIGSSDNHQQMPGVNDDLDLEGNNYHSNEPGGYAVVLASTKERGALYDGLAARRTYATSGIRAWFDFAVEGLEMGSQLHTTAASATASITLAAGMMITKVEVWGSPVGANASFELIQSDAPIVETYTGAVMLMNPVALGGAAQENLYYVRAFFQTPGSPNDADEALWSSPIWISWSR
jgi:hypothetical protein